MEQNRVHLQSINFEKHAKASQSKGKGQSFQQMVLQQLDILHGEKKELQAFHKN